MAEARRFRGREAGPAGSGPAAGGVRIDRLTLAVPGLTADEGQRLGREVARRLAAKLGPGSAGGRRIGRVSLRLDRSAAGGADGLAGTIAARLVERLG